MKVDLPSLIEHMIRNQMKIPLETLCCMGFEQLVFYAKTYVTLSDSKEEHRPSEIFERSRRTLAFFCRNPLPVFVFPRRPQPFPPRFNLRTTVCDSRNRVRGFGPFGRAFETKNKRNPEESMRRGKVYNSPHHINT